MSDTSLPGIYVEIKGDYSQLQKDIRRAKDIVSEQATGISNALNNALNPSKVSSSINSLVANLGTLNRASNVAHEVFGKIGVDLKELNSITGLTEKEFASLQSRLLQTQTASAQENALKRISSSLKLSREEIKELGNQFKLSEGSIDRVSTSIHGAETRVKSFAETVAKLPDIKNYISLPKISENAISGNMVSTVEAFSREILSAATASDVAKESFKALEIDIAEFTAKTGLSVKQLQELKNRAASVAGEEAQEKALRAIATAARLTREEIGDLGRTMGLQSEGIDRVATALHGAKEEAKSFSERIANLPKLPNYTSLATAAGTSLNGQMGGNVDSFARNIVTITDAAAASRSAFNLVGVDVTELAGKVGMTAEQFVRLKNRIADVTAENAKTEAFRALASAADMSREEVEQFGQAMGLNAEQIKKVQNSLLGAKEEAKTFAQTIASLPKINSLTTLSQGAQSGLLNSMGQEAQAFAANLTTLTSSAKAADSVFDGLGTQLDELRKHTKMTDEQFEELQKRLRASAGINAQVNALRSLSTQLNLTEEELRDLGRQFGITSAKMDEIVGSARRADAALDSVGATGAQRIDLLSGSIAMAAGKFLLLEQAAYSVGRILDNTVFRFNSTVETATLGISSAFLTNGEYVDELTGKVLNADAAMIAAMGDADSVIERLKSSNLETAATLEQLIKAYQETAPVALAKGFDKNQIEQFTVAMVQAAGVVDTTGMLLHQMGEETRSMLTGGISQKNTRIATALGVRNEDIAKYKGDVDGLFAYLMDKLSAYQLAGQKLQSTWKGVASNTVDIMQQVSAKATEPIFFAIRDGLKEMTDSLVVIDQSTRTLEWSDSYTKGVESARKNLQDFVDLVSRHGDDLTGLWEDIQQGASDSARAIKETVLMAEQVYNVTNDILSLGAFEWGVIGYVLLRNGGVAAGITASLGVINSQLKEFDLNLGSIPRKYADMQSSWRKLGQDMQNRNWSTGELNSGTEEAKQLDDLQQKLAKLEEQRAFTQKNPFVASLFGKDDLSELDKRINTTKGWIQNFNDFIAKESNKTETKYVPNPAPKDLEEEAKKLKSAGQSYLQIYREIGAKSKEVYDGVVVEYKRQAEEMKKNGVDAVSAQKWYDDQIKELDANLDGPGSSKRNRTSGLKAEREALKQLSAELKSYADVAGEAATAAQKWLRESDASIREAQSLIEEHSTAGMSEYEAMAYEHAKATKDAKTALDDYSKSLSQVDGELAKATAAYQVATSQFEQMQAQLSSNTAGSSVEDVNKLDKLEDKIRVLSDAIKDLNKQKTDLEGMKGGADQLIGKIDESYRVEMLLSAYSAIGPYTEQIYSLLASQYERDRDKYIEATGDKIAANKMFQQNMDELDLSTPSIKWSRAMEIGLNRVAGIADETGAGIADAIGDAFDGATDALADFVVNFEADIDGLINSILQDIARLTIQQTITSPLAGALGTAVKSFFTPNAKGGVYDSPSLSSYSGRVYDTPKLFAFATGAGVFAEAGPEAIMPLTRTSGGELGVKAQMASPTINVQVNNAPAGTTAKVTQSADGMNIDVIIDALEQRQQDRLNRGYNGVGKVAPW